MLYVDKEGKDYIKVDDTPKKEYASKAMAGTALGFGIGGAALWLLDNMRGGNPIFGGCKNGSNGETVAIASTMANEQFLERKECEDVLALTNAIWQQTYNAQQNRFNDRQTINQEMFGIYSTMRNGFDMISAKHNKDSFDLYKYSRDSKDEVLSELGNLKTEVAVLKACRPYQDALIQCDIRNVAEHAQFNLERRTCRMITGEVVLPNTPVVTGFGSYNVCGCRTASAPAAD